MLSTISKPGADTGSLVIDFQRLTSYGLTCLRALCEHEATNNPDFQIARGFFEAARAIQGVKDGR